MSESLEKELFLELSFAHQIIRRMQSVLNADQRVQLNSSFDALGLSGRGSARDNDRLALLEKAFEALAQHAAPLFPSL